MIPYFILIALPLLVWLLSRHYRFTTDKRVLFETRSASIDVFMLIFLFLLALRGLQCGVDTKQYLRIFNAYSTQSVQQLFERYEIEFGYKLLNRFVGFIGGDYQLLLIITSLICVCPLWYFYRRETENQLLTIALFLTVAPYMMYFSGIQQSIAMSLGIFAWYAAKDRKLVRFIAMVLLAMQFHISAFVLFPLYPLYRAKITKKWLWFVVPCMVAVFVFRSTIFNFLLTLLWREYSTTPATDATTILYLLILFGVYAYIIPDDNKMDEDTIAMRNILLLSVVIQIFALLHPLSMRMNYYYLLFVPLIIDRVIQIGNKQDKKILQLSKICMIVFFTMYYFYYAYTDVDKLNVYPYRSFLEELG